MNDLTNDTTAGTAVGRCGGLSLIAGGLAFLLVLLHFFAGPFDPPPPLELSIAEKAVAIRDATVAALKGEEYEVASQPPERSVDDYLRYVALAAAALAVLLGAVGFVRHEAPRALIAGAGLGALAITFQVAITLFFALLFCLLLTAVLDKLDFSF